MSMKILLPSLLFANVAALTTPVVMADSVEQELEILKAKIQVLEENQNKNARLFKSRNSNSDEEMIAFNGFASIGFSQHDGDDITYSGGTTNELSLLPNTWAGLQMNAHLYEGGEFVMQVLAKGMLTGGDSHSFELETEWLFFKQDLGAGFDVQVGRIRFPVFQESENYYVGNTYPWVKPLAAVYDVLPLTNVDGVSVNYLHELGDWSLDAKLLLWASSELAFGFGHAKADDIHGLTAKISNDSLSFRLGYTVTKIEYDVDSLTNPFNPSETLDAFSYGDTMAFITAAVKYDDGSWYAAVEAVSVDAENGSLPQQQNGYITLGKYFGKWLPYIGYAKTKVKDVEGISQAETEKVTVDNIDVINPHVPVSPFIDNSVSVGSLLTTIYDQKETGFMAGFKWDFMPKTSLKFQVQQVEKFDDTRGNFGHGTRLSDDESVLIYDVAIQALF
ncbi:MAG: hypothetical protein HRU20_06195 [Pseudomonadales bacterium]|nr:hypothetical protein [Pseudomonadales bacterium]